MSVFSFFQNVGNKLLITLVDSSCFDIRFAYSNGVEKKIYKFVYSILLALTQAITLHRVRINTLALEHPVFALRNMLGIS